MTRQVAVISRLPRPGQTKRRLAQTIGGRAAADLHAAFVHDQLAVLASAGWLPQVLHDPPTPEEHDLVRMLAGSAPHQALPGRDLASDLLAGFRALTARGPTVIVSSDVPHLDAAEVGAALDRLAGADVVLGPCPDGGYWLIAMREPHDLFTGIEMGSSRVLEQTAARAAALGLRTERLGRELRDVDTIEDLCQIAHRLPRNGRTRALLADLLRDDSMELGPPLPTRLHLELTNRCNSLCETCVRTTTPDPGRDLSLAEAQAIADGLPEIHSVALQVNGEPLLHEQLEEIIAIFKRRAAFVELNSNGLTLRGGRAMALIESGLDKLNLSFDGASAATYAKVRGVDGFDQLVSNTRRLLSERGVGGRPRVSLWMTAMRDNLLELPSLVELAAELRADEVYLQRLVYFGKGLALRQRSLHGRLEPEHREAIAAAVERAGRLGVALRTCGGHAPQSMLEAVEDPEPWRDCRRPWEGAVVMANGDLVPCCISTFVGQPGAIRMGNVLASGWSKAWSGSGYRCQRAGLLSGPGPEYCRQCGTDWSL